MDIQEVEKQIEASSNYQLGYVQALQWVIGKEREKLVPAKNVDTNPKDN